jgi:LPXTG-motif cell wall-anchored protein
LAQYDATVLQRYADRLYAKAAWIALRFGFVGTLIGALAGALIEMVPGVTVSSIRTGTADNSGFLLLGGILGAAIGALIGRRKAFQYRLQAQMTLCQMRIESNTRRET